MQQAWPTKQLDGTIFERHVYTSPKGDGHIDITHREKSPGVFETKRVEHGLDGRGFSADFEEVKDADFLMKLKRIKEEKADWKPDSGFEIKPEYKDSIDKDGKDILKTEPEEDASKKNPS